MNLNQELRLRTRHLVPADVLRAMGYSPADASALAHYQAIENLARRLPWEERLATACQKARDHMQESGGKLVTWGEIKRYHYCFAEKRSIVISTTGEVIGEQEDFDPPRATFRLGGDDRDLGDLFDTGQD